MPTYNDSKYIKKSIQSILKQNYENLELIIINDGSTDNTMDIINNINNKKIILLNQQNLGQLNALYKGLQHTTGKYITLMHSDDEFLDTSSLRRGIDFLKTSNYNGVYSDLIKINKNNEFLGKVNVVKEISHSSPSILLLNGGSNIIPDIFFIKKNVADTVLNNYILWNIPYWLTFSQNTLGSLKLKKIEPWYKYRIYEKTSTMRVPKPHIFNGCLRTIIEITKYLHIPYASFQRLILRVIKKKITPIHKIHPSPPISLKKNVEYVFKKFYDKTPNNLYFNGLVGFFDNFPSKREVSMELNEKEPIFYGKDARIFFKLLENNKNLPSYRYLLEEAINGFSKVIVDDKEGVYKVKIMLKMMNLPADVACAS